MLDKIALKSLALQLAAAMPPVEHEVVLVPHTGELLSLKAMELARFYDSRHVATAGRIRCAAGELFGACFERPSSSVPEHFLIPGAKGPTP